MVKSKDKKKKGKGMEKTLAKTEKKLEKSLKKELEEIGEDDIESLIAKHDEKEKELNKVLEVILPDGKFPSRRGGATFSLLPEKDELVLFGGDFFDNNKVYMYNDLFVYSIKKNHWTQIKSPKGPSPRTFHQAAVVSRNMGELWVFGGEFTSPSQSQFYHYNDLWMFSFQTKQWTKIVAPNGPSARSGHRMVVFKKYLVVFGGYYDNLRNCRFYNDTYLFNLETNQWEEMVFSAASDTPSPRSACQLSVCSKNSTIVLFGGFSKEKLKKDREKPIVHTDMYILSCQPKKGTDKLEWSWKRAKHTGMKPSDRISFSMITLHDDTAILFGGVFDQDDIAEDDDEEEANSKFFNDLYKLDLSSHKWSQLMLRGKSDKRPKKLKKPIASPSTSGASASDNQMTVETVEKDTDCDEENDDDEESDDEDVPEEVEDENAEKLKLEGLNLKQDEAAAFTLSYSTASNASKPDEDVVVSEPLKSSANAFVPHARRSSYLQFHKGILYLYGGKYENESEKEFTFNDMYALNLKRLDEWKILNEDKIIHAEIEKSKANILDESEEEMDKDQGEKEEDDDDDDDDDSEMEIDIPAVEPGETLDAYFARTRELWLQEASSEYPDEKSEKVINKWAHEMCKMCWKSLSESK